MTKVVTKLKNNILDSISIKIPQLLEIDRKHLNKHSDRTLEFLRTRGSIFDNENNPPKFEKIEQKEEISDEDFQKQLDNIKQIQLFSF